MHVACSNRIERFITSSSIKMERSVTTSYKKYWSEDAALYTFIIVHVVSTERRAGRCQCRHDDLDSVVVVKVNLAFSSPASCVTVLMYGRSVE